MKLRKLIIATTLSITSLSSFAGVHCNCLKSNFSKSSDVVQYLDIWSLPKRLGAEVGDFMDRCFGTYDPKYSRVNNLCDNKDYEKILKNFPKPIENAQECLRNQPEKLNALNSIKVTAQAAQAGSQAAILTLSIASGETIIHAIPASEVVKKTLTVGALIKDGAEGYHMYKDFGDEINKMILKSVYDSSCLERSLNNKNG